jgi:predicted Zn-dependent protease
MKLVVNTMPNTPEAAEAQSFLTLTGAGDDPAALTAAGVVAEEVLKQDPAHIPALMIRAALQTQKSMTAEATAIYEGIVKRLPDFAPAQKYLAALYSGDPKKLEEGFKLASKARESLPDDTGLAQTLAILNYQRQNYSYTVQLLQECARSRPLDAQGLFYMGMSRYQTNDKTGGREALANALAAGLKEPLATEARRRMRDRNK